MPGRLLQNADPLGALLALGLLWWVLRPGSAADDAGELQHRQGGEQQADQATHAT